MHSAAIERRTMEPRDVLIGTTGVGSIIGLALMAWGGLLLANAWNNAIFPNNSDTVLDLGEGSVFFAVGAAFFLVSAILIPALRAIQHERPRRP